MGIDEAGPLGGINSTAEEVLHPMGVHANTEGLLKTLVCDSKGVFLIVMKVETIIWLKEPVSE